MVPKELHFFMTSGCEIMNDLLYWELEGKTHPSLIEQLEHWSPKWHGGEGGSRIDTATTERTSESDTRLLPIACFGDLQRSLTCLSDVQRTWRRSMNYVDLTYVSFDVIKWKSSLFPTEERARTSFCSLCEQMVRFLSSQGRFRAVVSQFVKLYQIAYQTVRTRSTVSQYSNIQWTLWVRGDLG